MKYQFDHVAQVVPHIADAVEFYRTTFSDSKVLYQDETWAFVDVGGVKIAFVKDDQHPGHLAWSVPDSDLDLIAQAYGKQVIVHRDKTRGFYLKAPGEQWIEIISYPDLEKL